MTTDDADDAGHCASSSSCGGLYTNVIKRAVELSQIAEPAILAIGCNFGNALSSFSNWISYAGYSDIYRVDHMNYPDDILYADFAAYKMIYVATSQEGVDPTPTFGEADGYILAC